ncbi:DUF1707 and DUF2154 domain-containing protein [Natronosporangium hydrolyticum]|uniref:DUF1707 and DUF2154 domain-containing protein n=1 Tax=Natronosporangium hydrolyticum TaxID=2811111 RepID=A0A895YBL1_9ACTN|nr:DUF1707 domain-containing protein [Natronosporangium hydrolyticum]QSB14821.1 DUF1707 and DUF2154 domain-containing protein [Natronosporangium hydrolyticum]
MGTETGPQVPPEGSRAAENPPALRASDEERHQLVELLGEHAAAGRLSLGELEERVGRAYAAVTQAELAELTRDLPGRSAAAQEVAERPEKKRRSRWLFAILGGSTRRERRYGEQINVISIMGGDDLDLREVEIEGSELVINAVSIMGGATVYVPDTVDVEITGPTIIGGNDERGSQRAARTGAPLIRIRAFALLGGIDVWRLPAESRGKRLKEARRDAKALEKRGEG